MSAVHFPEAVNLSFASHHNGQPSPLDPVSIVSSSSTATNPKSADDRQCSIRGCNKLLLPDSGNLRMCDTCRTRHRVYANTKRAKRKMEKAALGQWEPDISTEDVAAWIPDSPILNEPGSSQASSVVRNVPRTTDGNGHEVSRFAS
jgi:hypothetical protein